MVSGRGLIRVYDLVMIPVLFLHIEFVTSKYSGFLYDVSTLLYDFRSRKKPKIFS